MTFAFSKISSWPLPLDIGDHCLPFYISYGKWPMLLYIHDLCLPCYTSDGKWPMLLCFGNHCLPFYISDGNNLSRIEKTNCDYQLTNASSRQPFLEDFSKLWCEKTNFVCHLTNTTSRRLWMKWQILLVICNCDWLHSTLFLRLRTKLDFPNHDW